MGCIRNTSHGGNRLICGNGIQDVFNPGVQPVKFFNDMIGPFPVVNDRITLGFVKERGDEVSTASGDGIDGMDVGEPSKLDRKSSYRGRCAIDDQWNSLCGRVPRLR